MVKLRSLLRIYFPPPLFIFCFCLDFLLFFGCQNKAEKEVASRELKQVMRIEKLYEMMENEFNSVVLSSYEKRDILNYRDRMIFVSGGRVALGRNGEEISPSRKNAVRLEVESFEVGSMEVTFDLYDIFCKTTNRPMVDDNGRGRGWNPVINVSWYDAVEFSNWMSLASGLKPCYFILKEQKDEGNRSDSDSFMWDVLWIKEANGYRLPTEIEWEFAAKGGSALGATRFSGSKNLNNVAWNLKNGDHRIHPVATKKPNERRIYDMSGNVFEWCWDWYGDYPVISTAKKYSGVRSGTTRILRGGSWFNGEKQCQTIHRAMGTPSFRCNRVGFRLARNVDK